MLRRHDDLVEIHRFRIDRDEADKRATLFRKHDTHDRHQLFAPALAPPRNARIEIEMRIVLLPGAPPQLDRRVFVGGSIPGAAC